MDEGPSRDPWNQWLLHERFGGDERLLERALDRLRPIRERVLDGARLEGGEIVLDVGTGDGLVGFGALERLGVDGRVIFTDLSEELLSTCERLAVERGEAGRCRFLRADASDLAELEDACVDVIVSRSVLCYVSKLQHAVKSLARVLRPGGRLSAFEPINRRHRELNHGVLLGYSAPGCEPLIECVLEVFRRAHQAAGSPLASFDETDLLHAAEAAGFDDVVVELRLEAHSSPPLGPMSWEAFCAFRPNPYAPTMAEAINEALAADEAQALRAQLQPRVERGQGARTRTAGAYLTAQKPAEFA